MPLPNDNVFLMGYRRGPTSPDSLVFVQCPPGSMVFDADLNTVGVPMALVNGLTSGATNQYFRGDGSLASFPSIPASQVNSDWNSSSGLSQIQNKPSLGSAAFVNTSSFDSAGAASAAQAFSIQRANQTGSQSVSTITGLASIATTGAYSDLAGRPTNVSSFTNDVGYITSVPAWSFSDDTLTRTIQTTAAAANGWQLSSTRNASATYSVTVTTTTSIGGPSAGYIVLEIAATNSTTASDWKEKGRVTSSQTATLAIALNLVSVNGCPLSCDVPPGWYARLRSVNSGGAVSFGFIKGQEVLK